MTEQPAHDVRWRQSLADGAAGTALLHLEMGTDSRDWLKTTVADPVLAHPDQATLFDGAPAVAFTLTATDHTHALTTLDGHIEAITRARLELAHRRMDHRQLPVKREFDLIAGLTGLGAYLLHRHPGGELLQDVLAYLVRLTKPQPRGLPGWWVADGPTGPACDWPGGHANLGMAHGVAGPLALLSSAMRRDVFVTGQAEEAIDRICRWLDHWRCGTRNRSWWPGAISRTEHQADAVRQPCPGRPSWCYGTPGLARAQQLAGIALDDTGRQRHAQQALTWSISDESQLAQLTDASLCHGWAGTLHTVWRAGHHDERLRARLPRLLAGLAECLRRQPSSGYGLLQGEAGVRLAQRAATTNTPPATRWDACLLLDG